MRAQTLVALVELGGELMGGTAAIQRVPPPVSTESDESDARWPEDVSQMDRKRKAA
jgi:hypothetical protein